MSANGDRADVTTMDRAQVEEVLAELADAPFDPATMPLLLHAATLGLSGSAALPLLRCLHSGQAFWQALLDRVLVAADRGEPEESEWQARSRREELGAALHQPGRRVAARVAVAGELTTRLTKLHAALAKGAISPEQAAAIAAQTRPLTDPTLLAAIDDKLTARAPEQTQATSVKMVRREILRHDPAGAERRRLAAAARREVWIAAREDGMSDLTAHLPAPAAQAIFNACDARARQHATDDHGRGEGEGKKERSLAQRRADALVALVTTGDRAVVTTEIRVLVPLDALAGRSERPAELSGQGTITAGLARELAFHPDARWRRLVTDPLTNAAVDVGRRLRRPPVPLADQIRANEPTCTFPTCAMPAERAELDHLIPWSQGGPTSAANLAPACKLHHRLRHVGGWSVGRESGGRVVWTAPSGRRYRKAAA